MDDISKINFETPKQNTEPDVLNSESNSTFSTKSRMTFKQRIRKVLQNKRFRIGAGIVIVILILFFGLVAIQASAFYGSIKATYSQAKLAQDAMKKQNVELAAKELAKTKDKLTDTQGKLHAMGYLNFIPIAHGYYSDADHLINAGFQGLDAAKILVDSIAPYADLLGLKGQGSFVGGTAQQRIETAVKTMSKITPRIDDISEKLSLVRNEIDQVDPNHYPPIGPAKKAKEALTKLKTLTDQSVTLIESSKPLIKILPELLGEPKEKKYLVLFQNDKELRPTGGFITAYSFFRLDSGVVHVDTSNNIYNLDDTISGKSIAPSVLQKYLEVKTLNLRDINLSPDFKVSMNDFNALYKKAGGYQKVDGIIAVDTQALVAAMNILGDIEVGGSTWSTKTDPRCDCPQVIYNMEVYADQPTNKIIDNRKGIIGDLMYAIMQKAFSSSPKLYWGPLFQTMLNQIAQKHILFNMNNSQAQLGMEGLNAAGRIMSSEGDYLHINEANLGGAKSNMFITEDVAQDYSVGSDGTITKTVTINYKNPYAPSDCNLERGNLCLNAVLRDWLRIYVPKGSKLVNSQGSEVKMKTYDELGKTVYEGFLTIRPRGVAKFTISYTLPFKLAQNSVLPLMIQKQPGTQASSYSITKSGQSVQTFNLDSDKTLNLQFK